MEFSDYFLDSSAAVLVDGKLIASRTTFSAFNWFVIQSFPSSVDFKHFLMFLTSPIGWCVSMISLAFVYYVFVSPIRLFKNKQVVGWVKSTESIDPTQQYE